MSLTTLEIDSRQSLEEAMRNFAKSIVETVPNPLVILNEQFEVVEANSKFVDMLELDHQSVKGLSIFTLAGHTWDCPKLRGLLENVVPKGRCFQTLSWIGFPPLPLTFGY